MVDDDPLSDDAITRDYRVFQRVRGHRYSLDDVLTAFVAIQRVPDADRFVDLGSGIGSVALMLAWRLPAARFATLEAQEVSYGLQQRNLARNGLEPRATALFGDFRDPERLDAAAHALGGLVPLVTGTPPYFPADRAVASTDAQRTYARIEMRGGVEAYLAAARRLLAPEGVVVVCADAKRPERVLDHAPTVGLVAEEVVVVRPRAGKDPLFSVWTLRRSDASTTLSERELVARTADGARAPEQYALRAAFGLGIAAEAPSPGRRRDL